MSNAPHILVAEDEELSRDMLVRRLIKSGFRVDAAADGKACLAAVEKEPPDVALVDIQMPGMSGMEVVREIRKRYTHDALPIILVTALGQPEDIVRGLEAGANDYVVKPIAFPVLLARMGVAMRIQRSIRLLIEADRQRVMIQTLGEACHQLSQPMQAVLVTLDDLIRHPRAAAREIVAELQDVKNWVSEVATVIHRLQAVGAERSFPYVERVQLLDQGTPDSQGDRPRPGPR
jgi:two-component system sensor histidine kinase ChiS